MPDLLAKGVAATIAALLAIVIGVLYFTSRPSPGAHVVTAEFENAFPLIEGMYVRVDGAIAGTVGTIEVNDRGNAEVELNLNSSIEPATSDATAAIRQQDTTGDSYVAFDPGESEEPLGDEGITCESSDECSRTLVAPRLDDLLNAFGPSERAGVKLLLVETAKALDRRGADLNAAALELKPAIAQANVALGQVEEQNDALGSLIASAENVTGQAAERNEELARMIDSLAVTLATVEGQSAPLDATLARLPETTSRAQTTLASLAAAATAALPLAEDTANGAPQLAGALESFPGFLDNSESFLSDTRSTLLLTKRLLKTAQPTLEIGNKRVVTGSFDLIGATADLLNSVLGGEDAFPALFGDDSYGEGEGTLGKRGFGSVAVEPGDLPGYPASHAPRNWLRVSAVINCEVFGAPIRPGCLTEVLQGLRTSGSGAGGKRAGDRSDVLAAAAKAIRDPANIRPPGRPGPGDGGGESGSGGGGGGPDLRDIPDLPGLGKGAGGGVEKGLGDLGKRLDEIGKTLDGLRDVKGLDGLKGLGGRGRLGEELGKLRRSGAAGRLDEQLREQRTYRDLMDFLIG